MERSFKTDVKWFCSLIGLQSKVDCHIIQQLESHEFCLVHLPILILEMSRHIGKWNVFLENKVRVYCFSATVGLAAMLQEYKVSPTVSRLRVEIRTF